MKQLSQSNSAAALGTTEIINIKTPPVENTTKARPRKKFVDEMKVLQEERQKVIEKKNEAIAMAR